MRFSRRHVIAHYSIGRHLISIECGNDHAIAAAEQHLWSSFCEFEISIYLPSFSALTFCRLCRSTGDLAQNSCIVHGNSCMYHASCTVDVPRRRGHTDTLKQKESFTCFGWWRQYEPRTFSSLFLAPCVLQRTRNKVFLPCKPHPKCWRTQPALVELALPCA